MHRLKRAIPLFAVIAAMVLAARLAAADPIGVVVDKDGTGLVVTVNAQAANIHFTYSEQCGDGKPCYAIDAGNGMVGIPASSSVCSVQNGNGNAITAIQCPASGVSSIQFKMVNGGTWSAYQGGGGQHTGAPCSPAKIIVSTGRGATSVNAWDGCREIVHCDSGAADFTAVEADADDEIDGKCVSTIKH